MTGISSTDALRQLQGNNIEKIEIITNPSARYDAEGEVGIINIILKKERGSGINGSFEITGGYPHNYTGSYSLNYRKKAVNLFTGYGLGYRKTPGSGNSLQEFSGDSIYQSDRLREHTRGGISNNIRIGTDFFLNQHNTLTISGLYRYSNGMNDVLITYKDYDSNDRLFQTTTRAEDEEETKQNIESTLSYKKTYNQKGKKLNMDFKWMQSDDTEYGDLTESYNSPLSPIIQRTSNTEDEQRWLFQTDYVEPLVNNLKFEAGIKSSNRTINNAYKVEIQTADSAWFTLPDDDNHFIYDENIYAGYIMLGKQSKTFSFQLGLRSEYSNITTELTNISEINNREYIGLFPSAHFSFKIDSSNTIQISYSRRLSRPRFRHLLPFFSFSDNRHFYSGNANLNPEYTHSQELGFLKYFENGSLLTSIYYRYRTGVIERITVVDSSGFSKRFPVNLSNQNAYGIEIDINYKMTKWWHINGSSNFYRAITEGNYQKEELSSNTYSWRARGSTKVTLSKKMNTQISLNYRAPRKTAQGRYLAVYSVNTGLSMEILNKKGTVSLSIKDLFNTRKWRSITELGNNYYSESEFQWRSRQMLISFNYRLNQKKSRKPVNGNERQNSGEMEF